MTTLLRAILLLVATTSLASAGEVAWKMHTINAKSEFPACAAFDVDHDGDIDIYSGGWWYEAPTWKQHKVRDVPIIRGRFDDYSNQPMDCNGDGWTDVISVNYRSETIYWIEHPGDKLGQQDWTAHVIDKPGASETGRLHDIDGDGDLDILPNGTTYAAWYEFKPEKKEGGLLEPKWLKHDLPMEAAGHGIGFIRRDWRAQLIFRGEELSGGNLKDEPLRFDDSTKNPPDKIHADASVPILAFPRKAGLCDYLWGRGHRTGLYWYWHGHGPQFHEWDLLPIDTSWSQCHAPLLADIDNDGNLDLIAGKRYMGHEGKDPGEYDPLVAYWYKFDRNANAWKRNVIQENGPAGFDLDCKAVDFDIDGDIDLIGSSRHGLFLFENLLVNQKKVTPTTWDDAQGIAAYKDHSQLMTFATRKGDLHPVKTPFDWGVRRWHIVRNMELVMGPLPNSSERVPVRPGGTDASQRERWAEPADITAELHVIATDKGPASELRFWLLRPTSLKDRMPAMLCLHPHFHPARQKNCHGPGTKGESSLRT